jgi:hypothetical protein
MEAVGQHNGLFFFNNERNSLNAPAALQVKGALPGSPIVPIVI